MLALIRQIRNRKTGLELDIFEIKGAGCLAQLDIVGKYFVGPSMTPPDPVLTFN